MMTENKDSGTENKPKFGSGCSLPFIFFFGLCFACGVKDGNVVGAVFFLAVTAFLLTKFLCPKPKKTRPRRFPRKYAASGGDDRYDDGFDEGMAVGFYMAQSMRGGRDGDDAPAFHDIDADDIDDRADGEY